MKSIHSSWPTIFPICIFVIHLVFQIWLLLTANALSRRQQHLTHLLQEQLSIVSSRILTLPVIVSFRILSSFRLETILFKSHHDYYRKVNSRNTWGGGGGLNKKLDGLTSHLSNQLFKMVACVGYSEVDFYQDRSNFGSLKKTSTNLALCKLFIGGYKRYAIFRVTLSFNIFGVKKTVLLH